MATGAYDAQDIWQYGEDDPASPFSDLLNLGMESVSDGFAADRARLDALEDHGLGSLYVPTLTASTTNPNLGTSPVAKGWYARVGKLVIGGMRFVFGAGSTPGSGSYRLSLPVAADTSVLDTSGNPATASIIGSAMIADASDSSTRRSGSLALVGADRAIIGTTSSNGTVWHSTPWTWDDGDSMSASFMYLGA